MADVEAIVKTVPSGPQPPTLAEQRRLREDALALLIEDVLVRQFLRTHATNVPQADLDREFSTLTAGLKAKNKSLAEFLRETQQTETQLRQEITKKLQWERYIKEHVTDDTLRDHFERNRDFYDRVTVQASHILIRVSPSAKEPERQLAKARLGELRKRIAAGELNFAEAARKYSQCQSASKGGDIGFFPRKWAVDEAIARAAFSLPVGSVSEPIATEYGLHLVKVTARKPGKSATFEDVKEEARKNYTLELWQDVIAKQRQTAKIENKLP
jgi:peptidyl-prolyl cis-trans isomerase C